MHYVRLTYQGRRVAIPQQARGHMRLPFSQFGMRWIYWLPYTTWAVGVRYLPHRRWRLPFWTPPRLTPTLVTHPPRLYALGGCPARFDKRGYPVHERIAIARSATRRSTKQPRSPRGRR